MAAPLPMLLLLLLCAAGVMGQYPTHDGFFCFVGVTGSNLYMKVLASRHQARSKRRRKIKER